MRAKCEHGYFTSEPCPWCLGNDPGDVVPVNGHGNGWLLRLGNPVCPSCGGPGKAGWGMYVDINISALASRHMCTCYVCRIGDNTVEAIARRAVHEEQRGVRKQRGSKAR